MKIKQADFVKSAVYEKDYPEQLIHFVKTYDEVEKLVFA